MKPEQNAIEDGYFGLNAVSCLCPYDAMKSLTCAEKWLL